MPERMLGDYGLNCSTAKAQAPAQVGLAYKNSGMVFCICFLVFLFLYFLQVIEDIVKLKIIINLF